MVEARDLADPCGGLLLPLCIVVVRRGEVPERAVHQGDVGVGGLEAPCFISPAMAVSMALYILRARSEGMRSGYSMRMSSNVVPIKTRQLGS